jgi:general secretion pathway protein C
MKALFVLINLLLLAAASWLGVGLVYQSATEGMTAPADSAVESRVAPPSQRRTAGSLTAYSIVTRRDLFKTGVEPGQAASQDLNLEELKETQLDLRLWGTVVLGDGQQDYAVVEDKRARKQELYRVGDPIQNAVVKAILREKVVLNVDGKDEILTMEEVPASGTAPVRPSSLPAPAAAPTPVEREMIVDREMVSDAMGDIGELMKQVRIRPYFEEGRPSGLSLTGIRPDSIFRKMGLRSGDVLQAVDGEEIRSVDDVVRLYEKIGSTDGVTLQIKRRGRVQDINFQVQ